MSQISNLDFLDFTAHSISYTTAKKWVLEIPLLNILVKGETPTECRELADKQVKALNANAFAERLPILKEELEAAPIIKEPKPQTISTKKK